MSYPDWVPMWLRTAMGRKCEDLAELAVPVTMAVDGRERFTMATFGPIAWRVPDGCGEPKGEMGLNRTRSDCRVADFVTCKHRPNARALLHRSYGGIVSWIGAESFDARCMDAVVAQFPKVRWSLPFVAQYLCAFDGEPAEDLENLVAIVRSHGKHFEVKSKKRAGPTGIDVSALPVMYDVSCLAKPPTLTATWFGPMASFDVVEPQFLPKPGQVFMVAGTHWKASERDDQNNSTWIMAHLVSQVAPHNAILEIERVERSIAEIATEMRFAQIRKAERARISREEAESIRGTIMVSALSGAVGKVIAAGKAPVALAKVQLEALSVEPGFIDASPGEALFTFVDAADVPVGASAIEIGGVWWIPKEVRHRFLFAYLATKNSSTPTVDPDSSRVQAAIALVAQAMRQQPGTVSSAERDAKAPPSIMVSLPKTKPGESLWLKWSAEAGALLTNASGQSVGSVASTLSGAIGKASPIGPGTVSPAERDAKRFTNRVGSGLLNELASMVKLDLGPQPVWSGDQIKIADGSGREIARFHISPEDAACIKAEGCPTFIVKAPEGTREDKFWFRYTTDDGATLTDSTGESVGSVERVSSTLCVRDGAKAEGASATAPASPQAGIFLTPDVTSDGPKTLHIPLSLMAGLSTGIYFDERHIGAAARLEMPANVSVAFVEIDGLTFRLTGDRMSPHDASVTLLDLVPVEGPSLERNNELADRIFERVNRVSRT